MQKCEITHKELYLHLRYYYFSKHGKNPYFGAIGMYHFSYYIEKTHQNCSYKYDITLVGRVANRVANGKFSIDGKTYTLAQNNGTNSLHGGLQGYDKVIWNITSSNNDSVTFSYLSKDGEEGFPGMVIIDLILS